MPEAAEVHVVPSGNPRWDARAEILIAIVLGLAAIAGAFVAYQREDHEHKALAAFTDSSRLITAGSTLITQGTQQLVAENAEFLDYVKAQHTGDTQYASYLLNNVMDGTLRKSVNWWDNPKNPAATPFVAKDPYWQTPLIDQGGQYGDQSDKISEHGHKEQEKASSYTRIEIVLATTLFLLGVAGVTRRFRIRIGAMIVGIASFVAALVMLLTV